MPLPGVPLLCLRAGRPQLKQFGAHRAGWHSVPLVRAGRVFPARLPGAPRQRRARPCKLKPGDAPKYGARGRAHNASDGSAPPPAQEQGTHRAPPVSAPPSPPQYDGGGSPGGMRGRGGEGGAAAGGRNRTGPGVRAGGRWRSDGTALLRGWAVHHYRWEPRSHED